MVCKASVAAADVDVAAVGVAVAGVAKIAVALVGQSSILELPSVDHCLPVVLGIERAPNR